MRQLTVGYETIKPFNRLVILSMQFQKFSKYLEKIETTSSRNDMIDIVVDLLKDLPKKDVSEAMYLMQGRVVPKFVDLEFNVARKLMMRAIAKGFDVEKKRVKKLFEEKGDLGLVSEELSDKKKSSIKLREVYQHLYDAAVLEGEGSQSGKIDKIASLFKSCDSLACRYVTRIILGNLRLGLSDKSVLDALSIISAGDKSERQVLDRAFGARNDIGFIAETLLQEGIEKIKTINIVPGIPVAAMLCEREGSLEDIFERIEEPIFQPKYDGLRCQIHYSDQLSVPSRFTGRGSSIELNSIGTFSNLPAWHSQAGQHSEKKEQKLIDSKEKNVRMFSRNLEDLTRMFPDVAEAIGRLGLDSVIFDSEVIGYDENTESFLPFQETIQRRRKYNVGKMKSKVPIKVFVYDIIYLNGEDISQLSLEKRMKKLQNVLEGKDGIVRLTPSDKIEKINQGEELYREYIEEGLEGIIAKEPKSIYEPGKRGFDWIKYKKSAKGNIVDTVDAVVLGYYHGRGARAKFGIGAFLIGVLNKKNNSFESIAKVGTGVKDDQWIKIKKRLDKIKLPQKPDKVKVNKELSPDVWVEPEVVVEVEADEITKSKNHTAGLEDEYGYSLRFPRLKIFDRMDKTPEGATTVKEVEEMFGLGSS